MCTRELSTTALCNFVGVLVETAIHIVLRVNVHPGVVQHKLPCAYSESGRAPTQMTPSCFCSFVCLFVFKKLIGYMFYHVEKGT